MSRRDYEATIAVMPDGRAYSASEDSVKTSIDSSTHQLLAKFDLEKIDVRSLTANRQRMVIDSLLAPNMAKSLKAAIDNSHYASGTMAMQALVAAEGVANSENLAHLQLIRLFPQMQGAPETYFYLEEGFVKREIPQLEFRESFYDTVQTAEYLDRLQQSKSIKTKYDEIKYDLKKLVDKVYTPIEDIYRTIINPQEIDLSQINWGFKRKRNISALSAIKKIGNVQSTNINAFEKLTGSGDFHSANHGAKELNESFNAFLKTNDVSITHVIMNTKLFTEYTENTWTKSGPVDLSPVRLGGGGVVPLPGINGVTAIVDVHVPDNKIYAINKPNALRLGEGPKIMRRYYDEERDASAIKMLDFHEHIAVNDQITKLDRKFGMTLNVTAP